MFLVFQKRTNPGPFPRNANVVYSSHDGEVRGCVHSVKFGLTLLFVHWCFIYLMMMAEPNLGSFNTTLTKCI